MALSIFTNESTAPLHLGNPDRDDSRVSHDSPAKFYGCLKAANEFAAYVEPPVVIRTSDRFPTDEDLLRVHPREYLNRFAQAVADAERLSCDDKTAINHSFGTEAAVSPHTMAAARNAVGASFDMIDVILQSQQRTGFALVWPPGHHAEPSEAMGFSYLSTVALAALYARDCPLQLREGHKNRVVVIDIDHHRGNGTAAALLNQPDTLFVDVVYKSAYDPLRQHYADGDYYDQVTDRFVNSGKEYPYTESDSEIGAVAHPVVAGDNILSLEMGFSAPEAIMQRFIETALPRIAKFAPDVVIFSLGLDSAMGDILGGLGNLPSSFYTFLRGMRVAFPDARHGAILEGGYDEANWSRCLQPALYGLHVEASDPADHCAFFGKFRAQFEAAGGVPRD